MDSVFNGHNRFTNWERNDAWDPGFQSSRYILYSFSNSHWNISSYLGLRECCIPDIECYESREKTGIMPNNKNWFGHSVTPVIITNILFRRYHANIWTELYR